MRSPSTRSSPQECPGLVKRNSPSRSLEMPCQSPLNWRRRLLCVKVCLSANESLIPQAPNNTLNSSRNTSSSTVPKLELDAISPPEELMKISFNMGNEQIKDATSSLRETQQCVQKTPTKDLRAPEQQRQKTSSSEELSEDNFEPVTDAELTKEDSDINLLLKTEQEWQQVATEADAEELLIECEALSLVIRFL